MSPPSLPFSLPVTSLRFFSLSAVALFIFGLLVTQFFYNFITNRPVHEKMSGSDSSTLVQDVWAWNNKLKILYATIVFVTLVLMIRCAPLSLTNGVNPDAVYS